MRRPLLPRPTTTGSIYVAYLSVRILLFVAVLAVCVLLGLHGLSAAVVALLVSGIVSFPLARRQREQIAQQFTNRQPRRRRD